MAPAEFDEFAREYDEILRGSIGFLGKNTNYYASRKADILEKFVLGPVNTLLEYGCGTGNTFPHLRRSFPGARLHGCDISEESLEIARLANPESTFFHPNGECPVTEGFDTVLLTNVLHHVRPDERVRVMADVHGMVRPGGHLCIIEHNPLNPLVNYIVKRCPLDRNAVLLPRWESLRLVTGLSLEASGYFLFLPAALSRLAVIEPLLSRLPLGGQYYIVARSQG